MILNLKNASSEKSELKVYNKFIGLLSALENRNLTTTQIQSIEEKLNGLAFYTETGDRKKFFRKELAEFEKFLRIEHSLIPEGYFMGYGMIWGLFAGTLFQFHFGVYAVIGGVITGMVIGAVMDSMAQKQGRVIKIDVSSKTDP